MRMRAWPGAGIGARGRRRSEQPAFCPNVRVPTTRLKLHGGSVAEAEAEEEAGGDEVQAQSSGARKKAPQMPSTRQAFLLRLPITQTSPASAAKSAVGPVLMGVRCTSTGTTLCASSPERLYCNCSDVSKCASRCHMCAHPSRSGISSCMLRKYPALLLPAEHHQYHIYKKYCACFRSLLTAICRL